MNVPAAAEATVQVRIEVAPEQQEWVIALLSETGAHAFEEKRDALYAYFMESQFDEAELCALLQDDFPQAPISLERIAPKDWNAEWERNFESVQVEDFVEVHPPFRTATPGIQHHIQLMPRMAFGTGHHSTTWLMLRACKDLDFAGKSVLDMGCGTAVLGIMAALLGATQVTAIDIDPWSKENAEENARANGIEDMEIIIGDAKSIPGRCYDIILANINRNVLLADRDIYLKHLALGGTIVLSGLMDSDLSMVDAHYLAAGLSPRARNARNEWIMLAYNKEGE